MTQLDIIPKARKGKRSTSGFTLVELSVVLVIIGLIIGAIFVGRDLIKAAQTRSTIAQVEQFKAAARTFVLKYNCLPGDCANATSFLSGANNGNGNFRVGLIYNSNESFYFWQHLGLAGLASGPYTTTAPGATYLPGVNFPSSELGGGFGVTNLQDYAAGGALGSGQLFPAQYGHVFLLGKEYADLTSKIPLYPLLSGYDALAIDSKYDDGLPAYGAIITWMSNSSYSGSCSSSTTPSTAVYSAANTVRCSLFFINAF